MKTIDQNQDIWDDPNIAELALGYTAEERSVETFRKSYVAALTAAEAVGWAKDASKFGLLATLLSAINLILLAIVLYRVW